MSKGITLTAAQLKKALRDGRIIKPRVMHVPAGLVAAALEYEADIETTIVDAMVRDGWRAFKMQYSFDQVKKLTLGEPGMCDHLFVRLWDEPGKSLVEPLVLCEVLWWEFKASTRRRKRREYLSPDQVLWTEAEKRKGFLVWIAGIDHAATLAGAARHYLESGLCRRREVFQPLAGPERRSTP
jgi:hypothetical protein